MPQTLETRRAHSSRPRAPRRWYAGAAGATLVATALALVVAAPVLRSPRTRLLGAEIVGRHHDPYTVVEQFEHPRPLGLYTQPATDWAGAALARLAGDGVAAYNLLVLATFPLAALFAFLLAQRLTGSRAVAWLAALAYAFAPYHLAHAAYHPHGAQIQWLPLYLLAVWLCAERAAPARLALLVAAAALVALSNFYHGLIAAALTPVALAGWWLSRPPEERRRGLGGLAVTGATLAALAGGAALYVARWAPVVLHDRQSVAFARSEVELYSARPSSYLVPPAGHPLAPDAVERIWQSHPRDSLLEQQITVGLGLLLLAGVAVAVRLRGDRSRLTRAVPLLGLTGAAAFLWSLPPEWRLGPLTTVSPSGLLWAAAPMFRAFARFGLAVFLSAAVLAGIGFVLLRRRSRPAAAVAWSLVALAAVELAPLPPWRWRDVLPTTAHRWLAGREPPARVLDCGDPRDPGERAAARRFPGKLSLRDPATDCADPELAPALAERGFSHLLVRADSPAGGWLAGRPAPAGLSRLGRFEDALLYAVDAAPAELYMVFTGGFHWREFKGEHTYRWMAERGVLTVVNATGGELSVGLTLGLHAFPGPRTVRARLAGEPAGELRVGIEPGEHRLELAAVPPGRHHLELLPATPATVADDVLGNGDRRPLSVALWHWRWERGRQTHGGAAAGSSSRPVL